jgi:hypothetical protein
MHSNRLIPVLLIALGLALLGAGCGSSKKDSSTTSASKSGSASISKKDFLKKGNAICKAGNKQINAQGKKLFGGLKGKPSTSQMTRFTKKVLIPSVQQQVDKIRALGAPKGDEAKVKAIVDAAQQGVEKGKQDPLALAQAKGGGPLTKANKLARQYGLKVCGS